MSAIPRVCVDGAPLLAAVDVEAMRAQVAAWRSDGARIAASLDAETFMDWGGGLIWLAVDAADGDHEAVRAAMADCGGHATVIRAPVELRAAIAVFQPQEPGLARLSAGLKASFDPRGVLNPGRIYAGV